MLETVEDAKLRHAAIELKIVRLQQVKSILHSAANSIPDNLTIEDWPFEQSVCLGLLAALDILKKTGLSVKDVDYGWI